MSFRGPFGADPGDPLAGFRSELANVRNEFATQFNRLAGAQRQVGGQSEQTARRLAEMEQVLAQTQATRNGGGSAPGVVRIEDIPGRRVPFDMLIDIPIGANTTSVQQGSVTISQEGPFVAVRRFATFMSALEFQVTDEQAGTVARFAGRSFGRFRPIHSAWDIFDAHNQAETATAGFITALAFAGGGGIAVPGAIPAFASSASGFRTMEFDGRILVVNAGSSYPRQNQPQGVPSSFWSTQINSPFDLGALDFFERGEVLTVQVSPTHVNNPPFGNVNGPNLFGAPSGWPFLEGQYDTHEGITVPVPPGVLASSEDPFATIPADPISRLPDGILTIGWHGYRIIQPVSP
jgi:hypothetical protein